MCSVSFIKKQLLTFVVVSTISSCHSTGDILEPVDIHPNRVTLSGFSSGGTFAQQMQFSYSSLFSGIAVFSHTYYRCGPPDGLLDSYDSLCTKLFNFTESQLYDPNLVHRDIQDYLRRGLIEDTRNLRNKRLYVYTGLQNVLFSPRQSLSIIPIYERYLGSLQTIFNRIQDANLVLPTDSRSFGGPCTEVSERNFFIGQCGFSGVTEALNFLLFPRSNSSSDAFRRYNTPRGRLLTFDQREFTRGLSNHTMDDTGFYYVPAICKKGYQYNRRCYLHLYFHGCLSGQEFANKSHAENTGLLEYADRKGIIVVFPQARSSLPQNEIGCWDTFGFTGELYATQRGHQIIAVKRILDRLLGRTRAPTNSIPSSPNQPGIPNWGSDQWNGWNTGIGNSIQGNGNTRVTNKQPHRYTSYFNSKNRYGRQQS